MQVVRLGPDRWSTFPCIEPDEGDRDGSVGENAALLSSRQRFGGIEGNEILTSAAAVLLTVLLLAEGVTILRIGGLVSAHMFIGMVLIPPGPPLAPAPKQGDIGARGSRGSLERLSVAPWELKPPDCHL